MISRPVAVFAVVSSATIGSMIYAHLSQKWDIAARRRVLALLALVLAASSPAVAWAPGPRVSRSLSRGGAVPRARPPRRALGRRAAAAV